MGAAPRPPLLDPANEATGLLVELTAQDVGADAPRAAGGYDAGRGENAGKGEESSCLHAAIVGASAGRVNARLYR